MRAILTGRLYDLLGLSMRLSQEYRTALNHNVAGGSAISRADVADFIVKHLDDANDIGAAVGIAY